jgi:hypothetical protein
MRIVDDSMGLSDRIKIYQSINFSDQSAHFNENKFSF